MKTKRTIYFILAVSGTVLLFASAAFEIREVGLALGFSLLMLGLYGISKGNSSGGTSSLKGGSDDEI